MQRRTVGRLIFPVTSSQRRTRVICAFSFVTRSYASLYVPLLDCTVHNCLLLAGTGTCAPLLVCPCCHRWRCRPCWLTDSPEATRESGRAMENINSRLQQLPDGRFTIQLITY